MDRQPHNNLWAEKLLQVSMPDSGEAWAGMEAILDRELPQRSWSEWRRWLLLILVLLLLIGVCNCPGRGRLFHLSGHGARTTGAQPVAPARTPAGGKPASPALSNAATPASLENPAAPATAANPAPPASRATTPATRPVRGGPLPPASASTRMRDRPGPADSTSRPALLVTPSGRPAPSAPHGSSGTATPGKTKAHSMTPASTPTAFGDVTRNARDGTPVAKTSVRRRPAVKRTGTKKMGSTATGGTPTIAGDDTTGSKGPGTDAATRKNPGTVRDTITKKNMTTPGDTTAKKRVPVLPKVVSHKDTAHKKPPPPPQDDDPKEKDHGWVFGIGLNQFFPIGGQRGSTYNPDGLTGTLSDYLPVPMIRYYLSHKVYLQVEAQLNTPQATKKNLVFNSPVSDTSTIRGTRIETSATLQQLYYFNIPLSFHYAVTDELNIGTGLQFSHLSNAIGNFDSTLTNLTTNEVTNPKDTKSFKDDTLYRRIRTNEFRFLIDASYTWKHIVVGVRYNQALSKFIDVPLPTGGATQSRNSSLQLYLRYILWDTRKKKAPPKTP